MCLVKKRTSWNARQGWVSYDMIGLPSVQVWPASLWVWHWQFRCGAYHCLNTDQSACEKVFMHGTACVSDLKNFISYLESSTSLDKKFPIYGPNKINIKQFFVILFFRCLFHPLSWSLHWSDLFVYEMYFLIYNNTIIGQYLKFKMNNINKCNFVRIGLGRLPKYIN